jgi:MFS family permease
MIYPLLPLFLATVIRADKAIIGLIEGIAETTASVSKVFSGWLSDRWGKRKSLTFWGYFLSVATRPFLYVATLWPQVLGARFADRLGKGVRTAPRDALIAETSLEDKRGRSYGFHRAMDSMGAVVGPLIALAILPLVGGSYRKVFLIAVIPGLVALFLFRFVREKKRQPRSDAEVPKLSLKGFDRRLKLLILVVILFSIGNSSDVFLILRAQDLGITVGLVLVVYTLFNTVYALFSVPAGVLSDRVGRKTVLIIGYGIFGLVYLGFALATSAGLVWLLFIFYGLYKGIADTVERAFVADLAPEEQRGTALGVYHTSVGLVLLPASIIGGLLWDKIGPPATFFYGTVTAFSAAVLLSLLIYEKK